MSKKVLKARWVLWPLLVLVAIFGSFLPVQNVTEVHAQTVKTIHTQSTIGDQIVSFAHNIQNGELGTGRKPDVCVSDQTPVKCVQYSWGAGHGSQPGLSVGTCANWQRPTKPAGAPKYSGPNCSNPKIKKDKKGNPIGPNGTIGLDCSGYTRWVYYLAYGKDVLGKSNAKSQISRAGITEVADGEEQPGDLIYFAHDNDNEDSIYHVGIYTGNGMMLNAPKSYDAPSKPKKDASWTPAFVREQSVASHGTPFGYYRYIAPRPIPKLSSSYTGTAHNITYNITSGFALSSIKEDAKGNISGRTIVSLPLYGSGPFIGKVSSDNTIDFTSAPSDSPGMTITFTGKVNPDKSLSGNYTVSNGQIGTWQVK